MFLDSYREVFTFRSWFGLLGANKRFWFPLLKSSNHIKTIYKGSQITQLRKKFGKFFRSFSELLFKFGDISFQEYVSEGISHAVLYGYLAYILRRIKGAANFISSGSKV